MRILEVTGIGRRAPVATIWHPELVWNLSSLTSHYIASGCRSLFSRPSIFSISVLFKATYPYFASRFHYFTPRRYSHGRPHNAADNNGDDSGDSDEYDDETDNKNNTVGSQQQLRDRQPAFSTLQRSHALLSRLAFAIA